MKLIGLLTTTSLAGRIRRQGQCLSNDSPFESVCNFNTLESSCTAGKLCCWDGAKCHAKVATEAEAAEVEGCKLGEDGEKDLGSCLLKDANLTASMAERRDLTPEEQELFTSTMGELSEEDDQSDGAKSGLLKMFVAGNLMANMGNSNPAQGGALMSDPSAGMMGMNSLINPSMLSVTQLIDSKYTTCPINIPYCQRMACSGDVGTNPEMNANQCFAIPGCCFDTKAFMYKSMLGPQSIPAPTCYKAIRTPLFHYFAGQLNSNGVFVPNFLNFITQKVESLIEDDNMFNFLANQHRCLPTGLSPERIQLEQYIARAWPGYSMLRFMQKDFSNDAFLGKLVDSLSTQCGWKGISKNECMLFGCCFNTITNFCSNPTDLTSIQPEVLSKIIQNLMMQGLLEDEKKDEEPAKEETSAIPNPSKASSGLKPVQLTTGSLPTGAHSGSLSNLMGRKRRSLFEDIQGAQQFQQNQPNQPREARFGMMNPMMAQMMSQNLNQNQMNPMMGQMNPMLSAMMGGAGGGGAADNAKSNPMASLMGSVTGLSTSLFGSQGQGQTCNVPRKLDCMGSPDDDELDISSIWKLQQKCQIKGCCWDQRRAQQMVMSKKLDSGLTSMLELQCPYKMIAKIPGMPDLSASTAGCCEFSPCLHTSPPADWTSWGEWSTCTKKCGGGVSVRSRSCEGSGFCPGMVGQNKEQVIERPCNLVQCESWQEWSTYGPCSTSCGPGEHTRSRSCFSYEHQMEIESAPGCAGARFDTKQCENKRCPTWSSWAMWSPCSATCGLGRRSRGRTCQFGGFCEGDAQEFERCGASCWQQWSVWSACTATCKGGTKSRFRECNYVPEVGQQCLGNNVETLACAEGYCEVWTSWAPWSQCAGQVGQVCGSGMRTRQRSCTGVIGEPGCRGSTVEDGQCSLGACQWSEWSQASVCETIKPGCGPGTATYSRTCNGGPGACSGAATEQRMCELEPCPGFSDWTEWTTCSVTCGTGVMSRSRTCTGQINIDCVGSTDHKSACQKEACPWSGGGWNSNANSNTNNGWNTNTNRNSNSGWGSSSNSNSWGGNSAVMTTQRPQTQQSVGNGGIFGNMFGNMFGTNSNNNFYNPSSANELYSGQQSSNPWSYIFGKKKK